MFLIPIAAHAQVVRGVVITRDSALVPGTILTLLDSTGTPVSRALSNDNGEFTLRAITRGTYRIEAKRLAFRPTVDVPITLDTGKIRLHNVLLTGAQIQLAAVRTTAGARCESRPDSSNAAFIAWEEAQKALRASQLTRLTRAYKVDVTTFILRQESGSAREPFADSTRRQGLPIKPFTSRPPDALAADGYLTRTQRNETFHAPDEDVLLSESFASTHCLSLLPDSGSATNLRLGFAPIPGRRQPEIRGILTIDRETSELRQLDFSYVNLPASDAVGTPGGRIIFSHLPEGSWLISEWAIWIPVGEVKENPQGPAMAVTRRGEPIRPPVTFSTRFGMHTTGGHVDRVKFGEETIWMRPKTTDRP